MTLFVRVFWLWASLALGSGLSAQQDYSNAMESADEVFAMKVYRDKYQVKFQLVIKNPKDIEGIYVERTYLQTGSFGQCRFLDFRKASIAANDTINTKDSYPLPASEDVLYRLQIIFKDGINRTYPPVRLSAIKSASD